MTTEIHCFPETADQTRFEGVCRTLRKASPVVRIVLPDGLDAWVITRYAEGRQALLDRRLIKDLRSFTDPGHGFGGTRYCEDIYAVEGRHVLNTDGAEHTRLRRVVMAPLSADAIARRIGEIERICEQAVKGFAHRGETDLMASYAHPVTETVMARVIGLPDEVMSTAALRNRRLGLRENPGSVQMRRAYLDLVDLMTDAISGEPPPDEDTVIAALHAARADGLINRREIVSTMMMLLSAGISSTAIAIGQGAAAVLSTSAALVPFLDDPDQARSLIDELVRHHPPFPFSPWRFAREEVRIGGVTIPAGAVVFVLLAATNRDPDRVSDPEQLHPGRPDRAHHLAFGHGPHFCVGVHLARTEIAIALRTLFSRVPEIALAHPYDQLKWQGLLFDRTPITLPVRWKVG